jgi:hypothetical protein
MTLGLAVGPHISALAQAAAESALTNALSSSSTVKAGSELNRALDRGSRQLGGRIQDRTSSPAQAGVQQKTTRGLKNSPTAIQSRHNAYVGSMPGIGTISIQGGEVICASASPGSQASPGKTSHGTGSTNCHGQGPTSKSGTEDKYKSFVTLPLPK